MPRLPRIFIKDAVNFVTCRGAHDETLFRDERDYSMFLELLKKYQEQYKVKMFAYCFMLDHLHLLVDMVKEAKDGETSGDMSLELSDFMHDLNNAYTKYFNGRYDRKGHLFRERFKSALVEKDENYLLKMTAYIHLNPQKLNITTDAKVYPYSSYKYYLNNNDPEGLHIKAAMAEVLGFLQNKNYAEFIRDMTEEEADFIHKRLQRGGILGSEQFISRVKSEVEEYQAQGVGAQQDESDKDYRNKGYRLFITAGGVLLVLALGVSGVFFYFSSNKKQEPIPKSKMAVKATQKSEDLKLTEWQIKLIPGSGGSEIIDTLLFKGGKFTSARLNSVGFSSTNYSLLMDDKGRIIWETMQTSTSGTATWRGEVDQARMTGMLSLRQAGKEPQDFSFKSLSFRRVE